MEQLRFLAHRRRPDVWRCRADLRHHRPVPCASPCAGRVAVYGDIAGRLVAWILQCADACPGRMGEHAYRSDLVGDRRCAGLRGGMARLLHPTDRGNEMKHSRLFIAVTFSGILVACGGEKEPFQYGANPELPQVQRGLLPDIVIVKPEEWNDRQPTVPDRYTISAIATDLKIPLQTLLLPNGDILVAEGRGGNAPSL